MTFEVPPFTGPTLMADASLADGVITARFKGTADVECRPDLNNFVEALHAQAMQTKATKTIVDFRELDFMNSSAFKVFVAWLAQIQELTKEHQYRVHIVSNPSIHWQRRSLAALSAFAVDLVTIET